MEATLVELAVKAGVRDEGKMDSVLQQDLMGNSCNRAGVTVWQKDGLSLRESAKRPLKSELAITPLQLSNFILLPVSRASRSRSYSLSVLC